MDETSAAWPKEGANEVSETGEGEMNCRGEKKPGNSKDPLPSGNLGHQREKQNSEKKSHAVDRGKASASKSWGQGRCGKGETAQSVGAKSHKLPYSGGGGEIRHEGKRDQAPMKSRVDTENKPERIKPGFEMKSWRPGKRIVENERRGRPIKWGGNNGGGGAARQQQL